MLKLRHFEVVFLLGGIQTATEMIFLLFQLLEKKEEKKKEN